MRRVYFLAPPPLLSLSLSGRGVPKLLLLIALYMVTRGSCCRWLLDTRGEGGVNFFSLRPFRHFQGTLRAFFHVEYFQTAYRQPGAPTTGLPALQVRATRLQLHASRILTHLCAS